MAVSPIEEILEEIRSGKLFVLVDDESADSEGFLCAAAEKITAEAVNFMMQHGRGLICLSITEERARRIMLLMRSPAFSIIGLLVSWNLFGYIFSPVHLRFINLLYPGLRYE